jgi:transposase
MPQRSPLCPLTQAEKRQLEPVRRVECARTILMIVEGRTYHEIAQTQRISAVTIRKRCRWFNEAGLEGLNDLPRPGRPKTYKETQREQIILTVKTKPEPLGLSFSHWTLDRLTEYVNQRLAIPISYAGLNQLLLKAGIEWIKRRPTSPKIPS